MMKNQSKQIPADPTTLSSSKTPKPDHPWIFRTYSGHSSAMASNALYRTNLARGQTGLSVALDLPTQTGYDSDHSLAQGEVGKVGVPINHIGDMEALFTGIPLGEMNTSMTINATAPWLTALYVVAAEKQGVDRTCLQGTVQNDLIKEYLSRGTYIFPPRASIRLSTDLISFACREIPKWNPINVCPYHLQEAGATPEQEIAFSLATALAVLDNLRDSVAANEFPYMVGRVSFFVNAGIRFVTELCKMRVFVSLWDEICQNRYGITDPKLRRFRYGVQVNSLGLTEQQPENNIARILLQTLPVTLSKQARARAIQLPAWNEAIGLPRPWDQQWSLRLQQILAYETDLLEVEDIFTGSEVIARKVAALKNASIAEMARIEARGGAIAAVESGYMKQKLVASNAARMAAIENGEQIVVGVNRFTEGAESPLMKGNDGGFLTPDPQAEALICKALQGWRSARVGAAVEKALGQLEQAAKEEVNIMPSSITCARVGVTTGEWADVLRRVYGEYRAPTGLTIAAAPQTEMQMQKQQKLQNRVAEISLKLGRQPKILIGKPGLDGHSNGAEQIALRARDAGFEVVYEGIRLTSGQIITAAIDEDVHLIGLSILSGSHLVLAQEIIQGLKNEGAADIPIIIGGTIQSADAETLLQAGIARVFTSKDFDLTAILDEIVTLISERA